MISQEDIAKNHAAGRCRPTMVTSRRLAKTGGAEDGILLIELLVVLAILALVSTIALPRAQIGRGPSLGLVASEMAAKLRAARSMAIAQNRDVLFAIDTDTQTYGVAGTGAPKTLPAAVDVSVTTAREYIRATKEAHLVFFSDGTSSGGTIRLADQNQSVAIGVEWLTGAVHIGRGGP